MSKERDRVWAGIDAGKAHHWAAVVDETGATLWSKKIDNDESAILAALGEILALADEVHWAVDISGTASALLLALLAAWLANRSVRGADTVAATALEAAQAQQTALPGEDVAAQIVAELAAQILALDDRLNRIDKQIRETFRSHSQAEIIESLPGMGPILGAEFVVAAGDMSAYAD
ncbi:IS110 family transposase, partial [Streptomyces sp. NPDC001275]